MSKEVHYMRAESMQPRDWNLIRQHYRRWNDDILDAGPTNWGIDPYAWDHMLHLTLTPIESALWGDIRDVGLVMYPQYPVGRYFVDFGNPCAKVAIECDGSAFHRDRAADDQRQRTIEMMGWTVYRIAGHDCVRESREIENEDGEMSFVLSPAYEFVRAIGDKHGTRYDARRRSPEPRLLGTIPLTRNK